MAYIKNTVIRLSFGFVAENFRNRLDTVPSFLFAQLLKLRRRRKTVHLCSFPKVTLKLSFLTVESPFLPLESLPFCFSIQYHISVEKTKNFFKPAKRLQV